MRELSRAAVVRIYERGDELTIVRADGDVWRVAGDSAELVRAILDALGTPRSLEDLGRELSERSGADAASSPAVRDALAALRAAGVIQEHAEAPANASPLAGQNVTLALCGGIVAAHAPALVELLLQRGANVRCAATKGAKRFFRTLALTALTHRPVVTSKWPTSHDAPVPHLELAEWSDVVVVYPATATTLSRIAAGDCSRLVSALAVSTRAPVLLVPAMNGAMLMSPAVQRNLRQLVEDGFIVAQPALGYEVARAPGEREPSLGAAPPLSAVIDLLEAVVRHEKRAF